MKNIFVDSCAWLALNDKKDQFHLKAVEINRELISKGYKYYTTNFVLDETITLVRMCIGHSAAVTFYEMLKSTKLIEIIKINDKIEDYAWEIFKKYSDKDFSFTDCTSFYVMQNYNFNKSFTNDHHFEQIGFEILIK